ncbi:MAG: EAL domain-containing protein [Acidimicrobiales bacterium]|nr:EAL domain-containing protein [Acidimicrobiales bacterium]
MAEHAEAEPRGGEDRWDRRVHISNLARVTNEALVVLDAVGRVRYVDPTVRWVLGYSPDEFVSHWGPELIHPDERDLARRAFRSVADRSFASERAELRLRHGDGTWRWYEIAYKNLRNDPFTGGIALHVHDITSRRQAEEALVASEERFRALVQHSYDAVLVTDDNNVLRYVTPSIRAMFGYEPEELIGTNGFTFVHPDDRAANIALGLRLREQPGANAIHHYRIRHRDGSWRWVESSIVNLMDHPHVRGYVQSFRDITFRREAEERIRSSGERLLALVQNADGAILVLDREGQVTWAGPGAEELWGLEPGELLGERLDELIHPDERRDALRQFAKLIDSPARTTTRVEGRMRHADRSWRWFESVFTNCLDDPAVEGIVANVRDTTERVRAELRLRDSEAQLEYQATHDPLTGLPNRTLLFDRMGQAVARSRRSQGGVAVLFCDLDNFKVVNDSQGHAYGDRLLVHVGERLHNSIRPGDTVSRFGGDEFVVLAEGLRDERDAIVLAERIAEGLRHPFALDGSDVFITTSIGIAYGDDGTRTPEAMIRDADAAMYQAKARGRARVEVFDAGMRARALERHHIEHDLRSAVTGRELRVHYQPIVDLARDRIAGVEALLRWKHPTRGLLYPGTFIGIAEETGLIVPMGAWVFDQSCTQVARWRSEVPHCGELWLAVNLSASQLGDPGLADDIASVLAATRIDPRAVHIEITESVLMRDVAASAEALDRLKVLGVRIAIDDFGTGYSSFAYLRRFPVDVLKIDRSFVQDLVNGPAERAIVEAVVTLGHTLGLEVVAEGVETAAQLGMLRELGCDLAQGFHLSEVLPPDSLEQRFLDAP